MAEKLPIKMRRKDRQITDIYQIEAIIKKVDVCRIGFAENNIPYIVAMNFGYIRGNPSRLYFHCANTGRKIDLIKKNNTVCFQMDTDHVLVPGDRACDHTMTFQSIVGYGQINILMEQYTGKAKWVYEESMLKRTTVLRLDIEKMTAKQKIMET